MAAATAAVSTGDTGSEAKSSSSSSEEEEWPDDFDFSAKKTDRKDVGRLRRALRGGGNRPGGAATTEQRRQRRKDTAEKLGEGGGLGEFEMLDPLVMSPAQALTPCACTPTGDGTALDGVGFEGYRVRYGAV